MMTKKRWRGAAGEANGNTKLTNAQVLEIRCRYAAGEVYQYEVAEEYGVSQSTIGRIVRGEVWEGVPGPQGPGLPHRGERHHDAILSTVQVQEIRETYLPGVITQRALAEKFGVTAKYVSEIIRGNKRKDE